jgi:glucose/arabinose dehydrogenase
MENFKTYKRLFESTITVLGLLLLVGTTLAQPVVTLTQEFSGLTDPVQVVNAGDGSDRIFVVEQGGAIKVFSSNFMSQSTFFTVPGVRNSGEQGLLSLAFDPDYATNGHFYVFFVTNVDVLDLGVEAGDLRVVRYTNSTPSNNTTTGGVALPILEIPHPTNSNHNGGEMHFGSDGNLYLSVGDGAVSTNAQNESVLLGKILRINVSGATIANPYSIPGDNPYGNEIYAKGLRNPFRWSFDRDTDDMWVGDVGQSSWEEITFVPSDSTLGANFGWHCYEGNATYSSTGCTGDAFKTPVHVYPIGTSRSVIGGVVYRGANPAMFTFQGYYVGADYFSGNLHIIGPEGEGRSVYTQASTWTNIADFGETEDGELLAIGRGGFIYSVTAEVLPLPVSLVGFDGLYNGEGVQLTWETSFEDNFLQFDVEMSDNAKNFTRVGTVPAQQSLTGSRYQFYHRKQTTGFAYYRLKMVDKDGSYANSRIIRVNISDAPVAGFVRPSLIKDGQLNLFLEDSYRSVQLISMSGNKVFEKDITNRSGAVDIPINVVSSGLYIVRLEGINKVDHQKIIVLE